MGDSFDVSLNITIKREKDPKSKGSTTTQTVSNANKMEVDESILAVVSNNLFDYIEANKDDKKSVEPVKSSNEILAELFKVFNSTPPDEKSLNKKAHKKKHKKEKKHKKHKKKGRSSSDEQPDEEEKEGSLERKVKKIKKEKRSKKHSSSTNNGTEVRIKLETRNHEEDEDRSHSKSKRRKKENDLIMDENKEDLDIKEYEKNLLDNAADSHPDRSGAKSTGKIIIKSLKNSTIYKEVEANSKKSDRKRADDYSAGSRESSISLSDEETYRKEKEKYYSNYYDSGSTSRSKYLNGRDYKYDRDRNRHDRRYERSNSREHRRYYDERDRRRRSESRSRRSNSEEVIDKKRLLEIARKNAIYMLKNGTLPGTQNMAPEAKEKVLAKMRYGGKTVAELTEFCKKLSNGEENGYLSNVSDNSDIEQGGDRAFNHPFVLKDKGPIVMNIRNSIPIPPKSAEQTKAILMQFPVSSGQHHRLNENEWVPVPTPKPETVPKKTVTQKPPAEATVTTSASSQPLAITAIPATYVLSQVPPATPSVPLSLLPPPPASEPSNNIFPDVNSGAELDVTSIITKRLNAMRKLQENPMDSEALKLMYNSQKDMSTWANSKFVPGQFTGTTGANILTAKELTSGFQAWAKRDQLISTAPVSGGMGMHLLQKMGWRPGEGLGKSKNGSLQPLLLEIKLDKKGLVCDEEHNGPHPPSKKRKPVNMAQVKHSMESKHPVSLLGEFAAKRKWQQPFYESVDEAGPQHNKQFIFKVSLNGMVYTPPTLSNTKKEAKAVAARFALQQMGIL